MLSTVDEQIQQTDEIIDKREAIRTGLMQDLLFRGDRTRVLSNRASRSETV
ncbi:hypothetical protein [Salinigranum halophilum]|uniref:hypothetical protein n=1 Tax=Salinigranum halophilum TaxID=2565931 RepID=UPI0037433969